jgi:ferredoxin-NADP reductase
LFDFPTGYDADCRCHSISSSPRRPLSFVMTVKRVANGRVSNWPHDNLRPGMIARGQGPLGNFVRPTAGPRNFCALGRIGYYPGDVHRT